MFYTDASLIDVSRGRLLNGYLWAGTFLLFIYLFFNLFIDWTETDTVLAR